MCGSVSSHQATHKCLLICYTMHFTNTHLRVAIIHFVRTVLILSHPVRLLCLLVRWQFAASTILRSTAYIGHFRSIRCAHFTPSKVHAVAHTQHTFTIDIYLCGKRFREFAHCHCHASNHPLRPFRLTNKLTLLTNSLKRIHRQQKSECVSLVR